MRALKINESVTNRTPTLDRYLEEIGRIPLLTAEEEVILANKIRNGDRAALEKLVKANLRFNVSVAKKYQGSGLPLEDLISEGNTGLIRAATLFDPTRGFKFISFAVWWIRQAVMHTLDEKKRLIRLPCNHTLAINKILQAEGKLEQRLERRPTLAELADFTGFTEVKVADHLSHSSYAISLDKEIEMDSGKNGCMLDIVENKEVVPTDEHLLKESMIFEVNRLLGTLTTREQRILKLSFGIGTEKPMEIEDVAEIVGLSKERVRQIKMQTLKKLRKYAKAEIFY